MTLLVSTLTCARGGRACWAIASQSQEYANQPALPSPCICFSKAGAKPRARFPGLQETEQRLYLLSRYHSTSLETFPAV